MTTEPIIPTAERTLRLVELLLARPEGWTPQELLPELDLSRSSLFVCCVRSRRWDTSNRPENAGGIYPDRACWPGAPRRSPSTQDLLTAFYQEAET